MRIFLALVGGAILGIGGSQCNNGSGAAQQGKLLDRFRALLLTPLSSSPNFSSRMEREGSFCRLPFTR